MDKWTCLKCELHPCHSFQERAMNISYNIEKSFVLFHFAAQEMDLRYDDDINKREERKGENHEDDGGLAILQ
jgi:hypothetical protein